MKAFPNPHLMGTEYCGMDLRDYFAAKAMQGFITAWMMKDVYPKFNNETSKFAYELADAMMEARK